MLFSLESKLDQDMLQIHESGKFADIIFTVGKGKFPAHRVFLARRAPLLADLCEDVPVGSDIEIQYVDPAVFRIVNALSGQ